MASTTSSFSTKLNVSITQNYRLTTDNTQFILQRRHTVDPTKSPGYTAPADGSPPPEPRESWKDDGFYTLNEGGITAAAKAAILRDTDVSRAETLADALRLYADETAKLAGLISAALRVDGAHRRQPKSER